MSAFCSLYLSIFAVMSHLRQAHLGATVAKCLTIMDLASSAVRGETSSTLLPFPQQHGAPNPVRKSYILQLPDELLVVIVEFSARNFCSSTPGECDECDECLNGCVWNGYETRLWNYHSLKTLSRVCRRFTRIAQPLLFRTIRFEFPIETVPPSKLVRKLHHTLKENRRFQQHCRYAWFRLRF